MGLLTNATNSIIFRKSCSLSFLFDLILYVPVKNFSVMSGWGFLGWTSTEQGLMCLAQGHNTVTLVRLKPTTPLSRVKHSTTEPLRSIVPISWLFSAITITVQLLLFWDFMVMLIVDFGYFWHYPYCTQNDQNIYGVEAIMFAIWLTFCILYSTATLKKPENWFSRPIIT